MLHEPGRDVVQKRSGLNRGHARPKQRVTSSTCQRDPITMDQGEETTPRTHRKQSKKQEGHSPLQVASDNLQVARD